MAKISSKFLKKRYVRLSWRILEEKFCYYQGSKYGIKPIADDVYDRMEAKYKKIAKQLSLPIFAASAVGFPENTPAGRLVAEKMISSKGKNKTKVPKVKK